MFWTKLMQASGATAALMIATLSVGASAATLVVRSSGPSAKAYPPGKQLADNGTLTLQAGDQVVILDSRGTRTLKGPGTFSPSVASNRASDSRETFAQASSRRARPGATRGVKPAAAASTRNPNLWFVDVERSSTVCVADPASVTLWRPAAAQARTATITSLANGKSASVEWQAGASTAAWPSSLALADGAAYRVAWRGQSAPTQLRFAFLDAGTAGLEDMASKLITKGCDAQLDLLIETVAIPDGTGNPAG